MPDQALTAGERVEWLHVATAGRSFVVSVRTGTVRRVSGAAVFVSQEEGKAVRLPAADVERKRAINKTSSNF